MYLFGIRINLRVIFKEIKRIHGVRNFGSKKKDFDGKVIKLPPEPTTCCMSGCANCVWVEYAEQLAKLFHNQEEKINKLILDKITDPNMRAFLQMELRNIQKMKETKNKKDETE